MESPLKNFPKMKPVWGFSSFVVEARPTPEFAVWQCAEKSEALHLVPRR